jgi:hypothetical protein
VLSVVEQVFFSEFQIDKNLSCFVSNGQLHSSTFKRLNLVIRSNLDRSKFQFKETNSEMFEHRFIHTAQY